MKRLFFLLLIMLSACGPNNIEQQATITQIAVDWIATHTAGAPTATFTLTPTPQPTETPIPSPTPEPDLAAKVMKVNVFFAPLQIYGVEFYLINGESAEVIGRDGDCSWLKIRSGDGKEGWIENNPENVDFNLECAGLPLGSFRPKTGYIVVDNRTTIGQDGELKVENGLISDGVIILTDMADQPIYGSYVRSQAVETLENIPYGTYKIFFSTGTAWLAGANKFSKDVQYQKFDDMLEFDAYTIWSITLHPVAGGQAGTDHLSESEFPSLSE